MAAMKLADYDLLMTFDQNLPYQQNTQLPVAVMVLVAPNNRVETALKFAPGILKALKEARLTQLIKLHLD